MTENKIMRILREANGYSQEYLGHILGIEQNTYSKLESGKIRLTTDRIKKLSELYKVDPTYFMSAELPIINYNNGTCSKGIINTQTFNENDSFETERKIYLDLLKEKDKTINLLLEELVDVRKIQQELIRIIDKLPIK